jgi:hypothetical protein
VNPETWTAEVRRIEPGAWQPNVSDDPCRIEPAYPRVCGATLYDKDVPDAGAQDGYGSVMVTFKPSVLDRTTWTGDDSLTTIDTKRSTIAGYSPSPVKNPSVASAVNGISYMSMPDKSPIFEEGAKSAQYSIKGLGVNNLNLIKLKNQLKSNYIEAQVQGGLYPSEIQSITYKPSVRHLDDGSLVNDELSDRYYNNYLDDLNSPTYAPIREFVKQHGIHFYIGARRVKDSELS